MGKVRLRAFHLPLRGEWGKLNLEWSVININYQGSFWVLKKPYYNLITSKLNEYEMFSYVRVVKGFIRTVFQNDYQDFIFGRFISKWKKVFY